MWAAGASGEWQLGTRLLMISLAASASADVAASADVVVHTHTRTLEYIFQVHHYLLRNVVGAWQ